MIGPHHEHWLAGYLAGLHADEHATQRYLPDQLQPSGTPQDDRAPVTAATDASAAAPRQPRTHASKPAVSARRVHAEAASECIGASASDHEIVWLAPVTGPDANARD